MQSVEYQKFGSKFLLPAAFCHQFEADINLTLSFDFTESASANITPLPTMLRPTLPRIGHSLRSFRRSLHSVPPLVHDYRETGIPEFLSPEGFNIAWTQYQSLIVERLNALTSGKPTEALPFM
jgi:hypothetical protein